MSLQWFRSEFERLEALDKHGRVSISLFLTSAKDPMEMEGQRISRDGKFDSSVIQSCFTTIYKNFK